MIRTAVGTTAVSRETVSMATVAKSATVESPDIPGALHMFTVAQYMKLDIPERTELLGGLIYDVSPRNEPHRYAVRRLGKILSRTLGPAFILQIQDTIAVPDWEGKDGPDPDIAVLPDRSFDPVPLSSDALALIEVSDTTCGGKRGDRKYKIPLYVRAGVPSWIVNVPLRQVEFYGSLADLELTNGHVFGIHDKVEILGVSVAVTDLFEPQP